MCVEVGGKGLKGARRACCQRPGEAALPLQCRDALGSATVCHLLQAREDQRNKWPCLPTQLHRARARTQVPNFVSDTAADLIFKLLQVNPEKRLGTGPQGVAAIKKHRWFARLDWSALEQRKLIAPIRPRCAVGRGGKGEGEGGKGGDRELASFACAGRCAGGCGVGAPLVGVLVGVVQVGCWWVCWWVWCRCSAACARRCRSLAHSILLCPLTALRRCCCACAGSATPWTPPTSTTLTTATWRRRQCPPTAWRSTCSCGTCGSGLRSRPPCSRPRNVAAHLVAAHLVAAEGAASQCSKPVLQAGAASQCCKPAAASAAKARRCSCGRGSAAEAVGACCLWEGAFFAAVQGLAICLRTVRRQVECEGSGLVHADCCVLRQLCGRCVGVCC